MITMTNFRRTNWFMSKVIKVIIIGYETLIFGQKMIVFLPEVIIGGHGMIYEQSDGNLWPKWSLCLWFCRGCNDHIFARCMQTLTESLMLPIVCDAIAVPDWGSQEKLTGPDGPFPLAEEDVQHFGTIQQLLLWISWFGVFVHKRHMIWVQARCTAMILLLRFLWGKEKKLAKILGVEGGSRDVKQKKNCAKAISLLAERPQQLNLPNAARVFQR